MRAFQDACKYMAKNDYQDGKYLIRAIRDYDDLLDEAKQQHNCVASYSNAIGERRSLIYVMRAVSNPKRKYCNSRDRSAGVGDQAAFSGVQSTNPGEGENGVSGSMDRSCSRKKDECRDY